MAWQYKVVYADFRGRVSVEGDETFIAKNERRSSFARRVMNQLGAEGWELVGIQPLWPVETAYMIFKKEGEGDFSAPQAAEGQQGQPGSQGGEHHEHHGHEHDHSGQSEAPTTRLDPGAAPATGGPTPTGDITEL